MEQNSAPDILSHPPPPGFCTCAQVCAPTCTLAHTHSLIYTHRIRTEKESRPVLFYHSTLAVMPGFVLCVLWGLNTSSCSVGRNKNMMLLSSITSFRSDKRKRGAEKLHWSLPPAAWMSLPKVTTRCLLLKQAERAYSALSDPFPLSGYCKEFLSAKTLN